MWKGYLVDRMNILMLFHQMMCVGHALDVVIRSCHHVVLMCRRVGMKYVKRNWMMMGREMETRRAGGMCLISCIGVDIVDMTGHYATCFHNINIYSFVECMFVPCVLVAHMQNR